MLDSEQIEDWISADLACTRLSVTGDGRHFQAVIVSESFEGLSRIARQRFVNDILWEHFASQKLHALSMSCLTPAEAADLHG